MTPRALLLVNVGTPDKPREREVRRFLREFLNDPRVIDLPWLLQKILVNGIIIPFRTTKSTALYKRLWTENGSPLLHHMNQLVEKLENLPLFDFQVFGAMRYGNPSLAGVLRKIQESGILEITVLPLFPQYATSTTGTVVEKVRALTAKWEEAPTIRVVNQFYNHPAFIKAFAGRIAACHPGQFDHIIFSYHGLPERQITKMHPSVPCHKCHCTSNIPEHGTLCYKATCYATTRLLMGQLNIPAEKITQAFQSRLSKNWLSPFTDEVVINLARKGVQRILVVAPAFVADCLETIVEIEQDYNTLFQAHGGKELVLVPSLNASEEWVTAIGEMVGGQDEY